MLLNFLVDLAILAIIIGGFYYGFERGLFRMVSRPASGLICIVLSASLDKTVGGKLIAPLISTPVTEYIRGFLYNKLSGVSLSAASSRIPTLLKFAAVTTGMSSVGDYSTVSELIEAVADELSDPTVEIIASVLGFVLLLIAVKMALRAVLRLFDYLFDVGVLDVINRTLGVALAGVGAFAFAWIFTSTVEFLLHTSLFTGYAFDGGPLYRLFTSISPMRLLLSF